VKFLVPRLLHFTCINEEYSYWWYICQQYKQQYQLTVESYDQSAGVGVAIASKIPVPAGSSFVISDTGKTLLEANDELRVYCDTANAVDVSLSILTGVN